MIFNIAIISVQNTIKFIFAFLVVFSHYEVMININMHLAFDMQSNILAMDAYFVTLVSTQWNLLM